MEGDGTLPSPSPCSQGVVLHPVVSPRGGRRGGFRLTPCAGVALRRALTAALALALPLLCVTLDAVCHEAERHARLFVERRVGGERSLRCERLLCRPFGVVEQRQEQLAALLRTERGKAGRGVKLKNKAFFLGHVVFLLAGKGKTAF